MYDPQLGRWHVIDPMVDSSYSWTPYRYSYDNPINIIDPDGMDEWEINSRGQTTWKKESETHQLFSIDNKGNRINSITIENRNILDQLSQSKSKPVIEDAEGNVIEQGDTRVAITDKRSSDDMLKIFKFVSDNTNVEWNINYAKVDGEIKYGIQTSSLENICYNTFGKDEIVTSIHSHPREPNNFNSEMESMWGDRSNSYSINYNNYVYMPKSTRLYSVKEGKSSYIRHIYNNYKRFINMY